jgi:hypothetical protein
MKLLHHYPTLSHSYLRNATRLFGFHIDYRFIAVHTSQRKRKTLRFTTKKDHHVSQRSGLIRKY